MNDPRPWWLTWQVAEVAAAILPWFGANPPEYEGFVMRQIVQWIQGAKNRPVMYKPTDPFTDPDIGAVAEAIQVLEHAGLLMRSPGERGHVGLTRRGKHALETRTVRRHLGLEAAAPTE
ncbi:hypothetical protein [Mycobacterium sp. 1081908.1]|uniref:hypothetical protein n=1 Tax=Mycobacterium sp. 1081908.1 TaxID=1834066 RepID=UPI0008000EDA|nr:hypothetical protein [Mycobacterium sp. 1081908.1]OBK52829.1 hypothetical protein A5655_20935 [Mycobacterium sp. 1081908.1]